MGMARSLLALVLASSSTWIGSATAQSTYLVTSLGDSIPSAPGTLRRAIEQSEADGQPSRVIFAAALFGQTIDLFRPLPTILAGALEIDGTNGLDTTPRITLTPMAGQAGQVGWALRLDASQNLIRGLKLQGFTFNNVQVTNAGQNVLEHLDIRGGNIGILLDRASDCVVRESAIRFAVGAAVEVDGSQRCSIGPTVSVEDAISRSIDLDGASSQIQVLQSTVLRGSSVGIRCLAPGSILDGNVVQFSTGVGIQVEALGCSVRNNLVSRGGASGILVSNVPPAGTQTEIGPGNTVEWNAFHGIQLQSAPRVIVRNNTAIRDHGLSGIRLDASPDAELRDNLAIDRNGQDGVSIQSGSHRVRVERCSIGSAVMDGIEIAACDDVRVVANSILDPGVHGVYVVSGARATIGPGNGLVRASGAGVICDAAATACRVDSNQIPDPAAAGVILLGSGGVADGNQIDRPGSWGVRVQSAAGCVVSRNIVRDATLDGISIFGVLSGTPALVGPGNVVERSLRNGLSISQSSRTRAFENLAFRSSLLSGVQVFDSVSVELARNLEIAENALFGIEISGASAQATLESNTVRANSLDAIDVGAIAGLVIRDNTIRDHGNSALVVRSSTGMLIEGNRFFENASTAIVLANGSNNTRVLRNVIRGSYTGIAEGVNTGNEFGWNAIHGQRGSGICLSRSNVWVHDNLIYDNGIAGIETEGGFSGALLVNNTIAGNGVGFFGDAAIWNCILVDNVIEWFPLSGTTCFGSLIGVDAFGFVGSSGNFSADPEFICLPPSGGRPRDLLHVSRLSSCVNRATPGAPRIATTDYDGDPRPSGSLADVGADEAVQSLGVHPPFVSQSAGGSSALTLFGPPSRAGNLVLVMASVSGTGPFPLGSILVPLGLDFFLILVIELAATPLFPGFVGFLDGNARHTAQFLVPPLAIPIEAVGLVDFTFAWIDLSTFDYASNPACVEIRP